MKHLGGLLVLVLVFAALGVPAKSASAQSPKYNNQLTVTGVVLPAQHVVVDAQGTIIEILSNTDKDVMPKVYLGSIARENLRSMTPEIYEQYRRLVPEGHSKVGTLYRYTPGMYSFSPLDSLQGTKPSPYGLPLSE